MESTYWHKQSPQKPLFPDLLWDKPEGKLHAGKLLIIGGNAHSFAAPAAAYNFALQAGIGSAKVLLPNALKKTIGSILENGEFAPSTKSGSFSKQSLDTWLDFTSWADGVLLPGDLGRNSETAVVLEKFVKTHHGLITITQDALDYFLEDPFSILEKPELTIVASFAQLQKLATHSKFTKALTYDSTLQQMIENLHLFTAIFPASIVLRHSGIIYVAKDGEVSTTKVSATDTIWRVETASRCSVWTLQNPTKLFAALSSSLIESNQT